MTASGDQTARLWDVELQQCKAGFIAHTCSIKSVNYNSIDPSKKFFTNLVVKPDVHYLLLFNNEYKDMWVTASRDGNIFIWDVRTTGLPMPEGGMFFFLISN